MDQVDQKRQVLAKVFSERKNCDLHDILIMLANGLRGYPEAIEAVYPAAHTRPASYL